MLATFSSSNLSSNETSDSAKSYLLILYKASVYLANAQREKNVHSISSLLILLPNLLWKLFNFYSLNKLLLNNCHDLDTVTYWLNCLCLLLHESITNNIPSYSMPLYFYSRSLFLLSCHTTLVQKVSILSTF